MQAARPALFFFALVLSILSCSSCNSSADKNGGNSQKKAGPDPFPAAQDTVAPAALPAIYKPDSSARFMGVYTGTFGNDGIIILMLNYISGKTVSGYDVHKGLRRNVNGEVTREGGKLHFVLNEPGDNRFDGGFGFLMDTASRKINGEWVLDNPARVVARHVNITLAPMEWEEDARDNQWNHADTALDFYNNGTCLLVITPENEHAQKVVVRGNFDKKKDVFLIEWEKNPYIAESAKMVESITRVVDNRGDSSYRTSLHGGGMELVARGEQTE